LAQDPQDHLSREANEADALRKATENQLAEVDRQHQKQKHQQGVLKMIESSQQQLQKNRPSSQPPTPEINPNKRKLEDEIEKLKSRLDQERGSWMETMRTQWTQHLDEMERTRVTGKETGITLSQQKFLKDFERRQGEQTQKWEALIAKLQRTIDEKKAELAALKTELSQKPKEVIKEVIKEVVKEIPGPAAPAEDRVPLAELIEATAQARHALEDAISREQRHAQELKETVLEVTQKTQKALQDAIDREREHTREIRSIYEARLCDERARTLPPPPLVVPPPAEQPPVAAPLPPVHLRQSLWTRLWNYLNQPAIQFKI